MSQAPSIAIIGAGMGGLTAAAALKRYGARADVYEQAPRFERIGTGIMMSPNAVKALFSLGLEAPLRAIGVSPRSLNNRRGDSGEVMFELAMGAVAESRYGAPFLLLHRGDLHAAMVSAVPPEWMHLGWRLTSVQEDESGVVLVFDNGEQRRYDLVIAADGVRSPTRRQLYGNDKPTYTGRVAYRTVFPATLLTAPLADDSCKWWGEDRHIVIYYISNRTEVYFTTSAPAEWDAGDATSAAAEVNDARSAFADFEADVRRVLDVCPSVQKWAILERDPMAIFTSERIALLGDACHPMTPYMAQGAAMAIEDAVVLGRCIGAYLDGARPDGASALNLYARTRRERTRQIQAIASANTWLMTPTDPGWVYGYDAWTEPIPM